jgi:hypothetical protein
VVVSMVWAPAHMNLVYRRLSKKPRFRRRKVVSRPAPHLDRYPTCRAHSSEESKMTEAESRPTVVVRFLSRASCVTDCFSTRGNLGFRPRGQVRKGR